MPHLAGEKVLSSHIISSVYGRGSITTWMTGEVQPSNRATKMAWTRTPRVVRDALGRNERLLDVQ